MSTWTFAYGGFDPENEDLREALCTLGNGYFAARGAAAETDADDTHYPGTYLAGGYNRPKTEIAGREIENEDLVNLPNWLPLAFRVADGQWFDALAQAGAFKHLLDSHTLAWEHLWRRSIFSLYSTCGFPKSPARFWASVSRYNSQLDRYEILGVMGPDEYHDAYPDSDKAGLKNNAYTNLSGHRLCHMGPDRAATVHGLRPYCCGCAAPAFRVRKIIFFDIILF